MARLNVRKRGDKWEYRFEGATINGKRKQYTKSGFTNRRAAQKAGTQAMNEYNRTGNVFVQSEISFNDYLKTWFDVICEAKLNKQTKANYQKKLRLYILPELGKYKISSLTPPLLQKFINKLYDSKMSRNTLSVIKSILSSSLSYAVEPLNYISSNPMAYVQLPSKRLATVNSKTQPHYLISEEDMLRILSVFQKLLLHIYQ
ncbi:Arm DNA-binding domain-containing protein [Ruminococcus bicirculans (ex Wegman et al. 2014)]|uniref:Arm DNA-binding domain-containing protein n=1 Tax=Ruminococcus bicirculans (ex Wegman et al. 2014) TaxID=1160721 RepID=UPI0022E10D0D|nr:Arm DNA-binding domain-containing protein [Ruminococcus bicirculans (ex Wegman et al. 2014)]